MKVETDITKELINAIKIVHTLPWHGVHGVAHWSRVRWNGLKLADKTGANRKVVELFAFLHDSCRLSDSASDTKHGERATAFIRQLLNDEVIRLTDDELGYKKNAQGKVIEYNGINISDDEIWTSGLDFSGEHALLIMTLRK